MEIIMDNTVEIIVPWDELPDSFHETFAADLLLADAEDDGIVCVVDFNYSPYIPGRYHGPPDKCYPAEEASVEIDSVVYTVHPQRCATGPGGLRLYEHPVWRDSEGMPVVTPYPGNLPHKFNQRFLDIALQFAEDWFSMNIDRVEEILLEKGKRRSDDNISEILADLESEADRLRDREIEDRLVDGAAADWAATRLGGGDK